MKTIKQDVRFQPASFEKIRQIADQENAMIQDTIRKLCDIGIEKTLAKNDSSPIALSPVEEEMLSTLKSISAMTNALTTNMLDIKNTPYGSFDELAKSIKKMATDSVQKFKDKHGISDPQ